MVASVLLFTVTALADGHTFEITTLRRDVSTDGRRATVAYTDDWIEDARRRDFTMNTLLADAGGRVFDPLGAGIDAIYCGCHDYCWQSDLRQIHLHGFRRRVGMPQPCECNSSQGNDGDGG